MQPETKMPDMRKADNVELLKRAKKRYKVMVEADHDNRDMAMDDLKFVNVPGKQWEENMKQERGTRPCLEFNKLRISCKRIINDMRANRPGAKVRAVEDGDVEIAEIREGLIRNIAEQSDLDTIVDYEGEYQVAAGMCAWRVNTKYTHDDAFNQDIIVEPFRNPFTVYVDAQCRDLLKRDAQDWAITERISKESYEERWPKADISDFSAAVDNDFDDEETWVTEETVRICEYWWKEPVQKEIWEVVFSPEMDEMGQPQGEGKTMIVDSTTDEAAGIDPAQIQRRRVINTNKIKWAIVSGERVLERGDWAGSMFPFIMVYGEYAWIDGKPVWWGLPRFAKDAQRAYNIARTNIAETIAQAPKTYFWATSKQAEGHMEQWKQAHKKNYPYMLYEPDPKSGGGPPTRMGGADIPIALMQESQIASDEIKAVTGIFDASMGAQGNESSGRAIIARQSQGEIATFNYQDNMSKGVQRTYEIILDLIPAIYDTERELRVLGSDGAEAYKKVNEVVIDPMTKRMVKVNDLSRGKYDVTVTSGPSFSTLRQEAAETYTAFAQQYPELMAVAGDLVMKSMDLPYADDIAKRLQTILPPQIQEQMNEETEIPPEVQQMMQQAQQAMAAVEERGQMVMQAEQELQQSQSAAKDEAQQVKLNQKEVEIRIERLRRVKAEFDAHVAQELANLDEKEGVEGEADEAVVAVAGAVRSIDDTLAAFMQESDRMFSDLQRLAQRKAVSSKPVRENGRLFSEVVFDDGETHRVEVQNPDSVGDADGQMET